ncbi:MAG: SAM-dependent methyltransferase [Sphingobacteriales bacterium]|nr:SAM-dependent methyltransferase [Sphingobacteriales bacterium]
MNERNRALPSSFRDTAGFVFRRDGIVYRQVNPAGKAAYDAFLQSGLYRFLTTNKLLLPHEEITSGPADTEAYKILRPEQLSFTSYSCEWSFSMLQDAALLTLRIAKAALEHGMILKDATPFNIQWHQGALVFIDTLSFDTYQEGSPWIAYRQFCESFLSPLLLMHYKKTSLHALQLAWPEGIPLQITRSLLPVKSRFSVLTWLHIHLHAKMAAKKQNPDERSARLPKKKLLNLIDSLETLVRSLSLKDSGSTWGDYYAEAAQRNDYLEQKQQIIREWTGQLTGLKTAVDFGANEGSFSLPLAQQGIETIAADADPVAINKLYKKIKASKQEHLLPLIIDFTYPTPSFGLGNSERESFFGRVGQADLGLCLAFIHHLCIGKNIPLERVAAILSASCQQLIIEFVPKSDAKVKELLLNKEDIYLTYTAEEFEKQFGNCFVIEAARLIPGSERTLYLMRRK